MRRLLLLALLGVAVSVADARADGIPRHPPKYESSNHGWGPHATSVTWPSVYPPGWYTSTYNYRWYYPWYAYYNFSQGPYANWTAAGGYAGYAYHGPAGVYKSHQPPAQPYIGEWYGRVQSRSSYDSLQEMTGNPLPKPREVKEEDKDKNKDKK